MANSDRTPARNLAVLGLLAAVLYAAKLAMAWMPNIEPVSLLVMVYISVLGWRALLPIYAYILLEITTWGFGYWSACYLYVWLILAAAARLLRRVARSATGLTGMRLTWQVWPLSSRARAAACSGLSFTPSMRAYS